MKQFDDIFRENADKAFADYNADHLADEGWNSFMASRKKESRLKAIVIPLWAKAASITLIVGTSALITYLAINRRNAEEILSLSETESKIEIPATVHSVSESPASAVITVKPGPGKINNGARSMVGLAAESVPEKPVLEEHLYGERTPEPDDPDVFPVIAENKLLPVEDTINLTSKEILTELPSGETKETATTEEKNRYSKPKFMTGLSGVLANVKNASSAAPGVSIGFYVEQKITKRISFRPGLALAINSLGVDNKGGNFESTYSVPLIDGNNGMLDSYNGELRMIAMELPLNIVFKAFERKRSGIYLSAGASTMIYFSQKFTGDFVNEYTQEQFNATSGTMEYEKRSSTVTVDNSYSAFSHTDYFGLANFSAGYTHPYGKTATLLIEPFMQFPLSDLTALNLRVRYGGISVKIRFGTKIPKK
ncbi:MAG: PorT family protein [Bacteroidales bacterium]|jgi:hypothetical protein|nr:PorT family protein [Bacteroidales bacterium]